jgi:hypothetical protein
VRPHAAGSWITGASFDDTLVLNLQTRYDVETVQRAIGKDLARIARVTVDAA